MAKSSKTKSTQRLNDFRLKLALKILQLFSSALIAFYGFFWFRLFNVFTIAYLILLFLGTLEECNQSNQFGNCFSEQARSVISIGNIESFSVLVAAILYVFESSSRKNNQQYEAWQVIDNAFVAQVPTSIARIKALEDLCKDGVSLRNIDLPKGADLTGITLFKANLPKSNFEGVELSFSNLAFANMQGANLKEANLMFAKFYKTSLRGANLSASMIGCANFVGADLRDAKLEKAQLGGDSVQLSEIDLENDFEKLLYIVLINLSSNSYSLKHIGPKKIEAFDEENSAALHYLATMRRIIQHESMIGSKIGSNRLLTEFYFLPELISSIKKDFNNSILKISSYLNDTKYRILLLGTNLYSADLSGANLHDANLRGVNLSNASLARADLSGADFREANLNQTDLTGARYSHQTQLPIDFDPIKYGMILD